MPAWPAGPGREVHRELDSTNAEALRRASAGASGPTWFLARRQNSARGRRGRAWSSGEGNFAASLLMQAPGPPAQTALRSFVAALALFDALAALTGRPAAFSLKWPNDVLLHGDKLAGILLETGGPPGAAPRLVIGFGVNLASVPAPGELGPDALPPASLRGALGISPDPEEVLALLAPAVVHWEATLRDAGFAPLRTAWLARAARLGQEITARLPGRAVTGRFETIDATGALVLATSSGRIALPAAEVFFRATPEVADAARD